MESNLRIELHLPTGRLLVYEEESCFINIFYNARFGNGYRRNIVDKCECIPHDTMCGPFSRDPEIARANRVFSGVKTLSQSKMAAYMFNYGANEFPSYY